MAKRGKPILVHSEPIIMRTTTTPGRRRVGPPAVEDAVREKRDSVVGFVGDFEGAVNTLPPILRQTFPPSPWLERKV